jgi:HlyD family secretion protein
MAERDVDRSTASERTAPAPGPRARPAATAESALTRAHQHPTVPAPPDPSRNDLAAPRRRPLRWVAAAFLAALALALLAALASRLAPERVTTTPVVRRDVARTLVLTGHVRPPARSRLGASLAGTVREVLVREGERVRAGQLLVRLDADEPAAALAQAQAALAQATARARTTLEQAELAYRQAARDLERARALHAQGAVSTRDLEVATRESAAARAELDAVRARSAAAGAAGPLAEVARARAAVEAARARVGDTRVTAPAEATVLVRAVEPGDAVTPGQVLLELALAGPAELEADAREENLADLRPGAPAVASADAFPDSSFAARVDWLSPVVDRAQGTVTVRFAVPAPPPYLRADMTVSINVEAERRADALVVPRGAVRDLGGGAPWVTVAEDGRAVRREVRIGIVGDSLVEVRSGLAADERVLPLDVEPGAHVRPVAGGTSER